jgi:hypothetical protein
MRHAGSDGGGLEFVTVHAPPRTHIGRLFWGSVHVSINEVEVDTSLLWL